MISENPTTDELQRRIRALEREVADYKARLAEQRTATMKQQRYGLVWEDVPEAFDAEAENRLPILEEDTSLSVLQDDGRPTHLLIEGDNYHALTCLNYTHRGRVDVIYIDPPYNTGSDSFIYRDRRFLTEYPNGQMIDGNHPLRHSVWLSFMEKRLRLAKELLSQRGVIFISIDDNEQAQLKLLCDKVFGEKKFVDIFSWVKTETPANLSYKTKQAIEYILCYTFAERTFKFKGLSKTSSSNNGLMNQTNSVHTLVFPANKVDTKLKDGVYKSGTYGTKSYQIDLLEDTEVKDGFFVKEVKLRGKFKWGQDNLEQEIKRGTQVSIKTKAFSPSYEKQEYEPEVPWNLINKSFGVGTNEDATAELERIIGKTDFKNPKPSSLIRYLAGFTNNKNAIVLDFFAGSGTTGDAVAQLNAEDGGQRQCILVQQQEDTKICETVTRERCCKVLTGYETKEGEHVDGLGGSLRYYRTAFVGKHRAQQAGDEDTVALALKAGCLLAIAENTLSEQKRTDYYQLFTDGDSRTTAIYFREGIEQWDAFLADVRQTEGHVVAYVFSWGDASEYEDDFTEFGSRVELKSIPKPILDIYKALA